MRVKNGHFTHQLAANFIKNANITWFNTHCENNSLTFIDAHLLTTFILLEDYLRHIKLIISQFLI